MEKDTMAYQLAVLRDTQMVQRRQLEAMYPYIDWARMPFSSYGDFFRLHDIITDCGEVWTNAYGRSNEEADSARKYLKDYSGKGRDIELFNFGWSGGSGYGQYLFNWSLGWIVNNSGSAGLDVVATSSKMSFDVTSDYASTVVGLYRYTTFEKKVLTVRISGMRTGEKASISFNKGNGDEVQVSIYNDGIMKVTLDDTMRALAIGVSNITDKSNRHIVIEQIPNYRGAIVGDGVDDYGQCVSDFALPDDYTVVAMRERFEASATLIGKNIDSGSASAFDFETGTGSAGTDKYDCHSYGARTRFSTYPKLFSYQTKTSYNGIEIAVGTSTDTEADSLTIFKSYINSSYHAKAAIYSFGVFNRTLTADELRIVENCMYAEWICMTGQLEGIEYYDILDARFRSNEEDAEKRDKWVGRFGKLHMTLHNYAYSQMSGWDGWPLPKQSTFSVLKQSSAYWLDYVGAPAAVKTNSWGIRIVSNPTGDAISLIYISSSNSVVKTIALSEGVVNIIPPMQEDFANLAFSLPNHPVGSVVEFEQIPLYGGALVSDGVDDYAVSDEVIDEEIGGVVMMAEKISDPTTTYGNIFSSIVGLGGSGKEIAGLVSKGRDTITMGDPWTTLSKSSDAAYGLARSPIAPDNKLMLGNNKSNEWGNSALYQLRLIKNQPTDIQLEAIKWQCRKEHEDYLIHRGWKEIG